MAPLASLELDRLIKDMRDTAMGSYLDVPRGKVLEWAGRLKAIRESLPLEE